MTDERLFTSVNFLSQSGQVNGFLQVWISIYYATTNDHFNCLNVW